jgi:hypothetical protein
MSLLNKETWIRTMETLVEEQLSSSTKIFQNLPEEVLSFSETGEWSVKECLVHLNSYASFYFPRITKALESQKSSSNNKPIRKSWIGSYFIKMMAPKENGKKYKALKRHLPNPNASDPYQNVADFIQYLEDLLTILSLARKYDPNKGRVTSSISPIINLKPCDAIEFVLVHNQRHLIQAQKQIKKFRRN